MFVLSEITGTHSMLWLILLGACIAVGFFAFAFKGTHKN